MLPWLDRYGFFDRVDVRKIYGDLPYTGQALFDIPPADVHQFKVHEPALKTPAFVYLGLDGARHYVPGRKLKHVGRIALHEPLPVPVNKKTAFSARAFR